MPDTYLPPDGFHPRQDDALARLDRTTMRFNRAFVVANAAVLVTVMLLACTSGGLMGTRLFGRINLGIVLGLVEGTLLLLSAARYDRRLRRNCDPVAESLRADRLREERLFEDRPRDIRHGNGPGLGNGLGHGNGHGHGHSHRAVNR
jgi:uncharacterized membrane protein (DUF485 family)